MSDRASNYATLISTKKILYVPICVIIERMATLDSQLFWANKSERLTEDVQQTMLFMLNRFLTELHHTSDAYENGRVGLFMGDWKEDRLRADKIFTNLLNNLRKVGVARTVRGNRAEFGNFAKTLPDEWDRLYSILEKKCRLEYSKNAGDTSNYFHSSSPTNWQRTMASIILSLDNRVTYADPDTYLILLCYSRIKAQFLRQIETMQVKYGDQEKFNKDKILCVSDVDVCLSCPTCMRFTAEIGGRSYLTEKNQDKVLQQLYPGRR